jgi:hypothetical protein
MAKAKIDYYRFQDSDERVLIAYCNKGTFLKMAQANCKQYTSANWIKERMSATHNQSELELMKFNEGMMIVVEKGFAVDFIPLQPVSPICESCNQRQPKTLECLRGYNQSTGYCQRTNYNCERFRRIILKQQREKNNG